jgi:hypothetical protein
MLLLLSESLSKRGPIPPPVPTLIVSPCIRPSARPKMFPIILSVSAPHCQAYLAGVAGGGAAGESSALPRSRLLFGAHGHGRPSLHLALPRPCASRPPSQPRTSFKRKEGRPFISRSVARKCSWFTCVKVISGPHLLKWLGACKGPWPLGNSRSALLWIKFQNVKHWRCPVHPYTLRYN